MATGAGRSDPPPRRQFDEGCHVQSEPVTRETDSRAFASVLITATLFGIAAMVYSLVMYRFQMRWEHGFKADIWFQPGDVWLMVDGGRFVWHGALGYVYQGVGQSYALPLPYILLAPIAAIVDHFHLVEPLVPIPRASGWPVLGPYILLFNVFVLDAVRRLAWDLGMRSRLWRVQVVAVLVVCVPAFEFGHFEDVLALTFVLHAVRYLLLRRPVMSCLLLSLAISSKQWAVLAVPLVLVLTPKGRRIVASVSAAALPGVFVLIVLLTDPRHGLAALFSPTSPKKTDPGHVSLFLTWFGSRTSQISRALAVCASPFVAWGFRRLGRPAMLLGALSVLLVLRPLFEPVVYAYYWMPAFVAAGMVGVAVSKSVRLRDWIWQVTAIVWSLPHSNPRTEGLWWVVELSLVLLTWRQVLVNCGFRIPSWSHLRWRHKTGGAAGASAVEEQGIEVGSSSAR